MACAWQLLPGYPLLVLANRDEFYARPTAPLASWSPEGGPALVGGRDLQGGGTWLGVRGRRFAALTNVREPGVPVPPDAPSRGELVSGFLASELSPGAWLRDLAPERYAGFNLLVSDGEALAHASNRGPAGRSGVLEPGLYGLSNATLDTPWPKLVRLKAGLEEALGEGPETGQPWGEASAREGRCARLLDLLRDPARAPDAELPVTGVGLEAERYLSSIFVAAGAYGTRSSTVVLSGAAQVEVWEQTFVEGEPGGLAYALVPTSEEARD